MVSGIVPSATRSQWRGRGGISPHFPILSRWNRDHPESVLEGFKVQSISRGTVAFAMVSVNERRPRRRCGGAFFHFHINGRETSLPDYPSRVVPVQEGIMPFMRHTSPFLANSASNSRWIDSSSSSYSICQPPFLTLTSAPSAPL